jgi:hypothetical protein
MERPLVKAKPVPGGGLECWFRSQLETADEGPSGGFDDESR